MKRKFREILDRVLRGGIKVVMLAGVAFTVTACYGVVYPDIDQNVPWKADEDTTVRPADNTQPPVERSEIMTDEPV